MTDWSNQKEIPKETLFTEWVKGKEIGLLETLRRNKQKRGEKQKRLLKNRIE